MLSDRARRRIAISRHGHRCRTGVGAYAASHRVARL